MTDLKGRVDVRRVVVRYKTSWQATESALACHRSGRQTVTAGLSLILDRSICRKPSEKACIRTSDSRSCCRSKSVRTMD